jgi:hypothetical protein
MDRQTVDAFVQKEMEGMRDRPSMYCQSHDGLEHSFILLMLFVKLAYPNPNRDPRFVMERYHQIGHKLYRTHAAMLSHTLRDMPLNEFSRIVYDISQTVLAEIRESAVETK